MIQRDTIELLRECDAGVQMGIRSIEDVLSRVQGENMRSALQDCQKEHLELQKQIQKRLHRFHDQGKSPNPIATGMSYLKTNFKLGLNESDSTIASLMTDGCNMGVKSLNRYLNAYGAAEEYAKDIAKRLIHLEERLTQQLRDHL